MPVGVDERKTARGGYSTVFRLKGSATTRPLERAPTAVALSSGTRKQTAGVDGFARGLITRRRALPVLPARGPLANDPVLRGLYVIQTGDESSTREILASLEADASIERCYVAPQRGILPHRSTFVTPSDDADCDWRQQIKLNEAQKLAQWRTIEEISVAVIDSGYDDHHPQLVHLKLEDHCTNLHAVGSDPIGHGSHVAGLIAALNTGGNGFTGVATDCVDLVMHRGIAEPHDVAGYYRALRAGGAARIVNLSIGGEGEDPTETELIEDALAAGAIVVAAMGNSREYGDPTIFPAALKEVIAVGAVSGTGGVASFSSSGDHIMLSAPGVGIASTVPTYPVADLSPYGVPPLAKLSGTSMATPLVTGVIARMLAYRPTLTRTQVIDIIMNKLSGPWNFDLGHGILDAYALLAAL